MTLHELDRAFNRFSEGCEVLFALAGFVRWKALDRGRRFVVLAIAAAAACDWTGVYLGHLIRNSQPAAWTWYLLSVLLILEALACYAADRWRRPIRIFAALYAVLWVVTLATGLESPMAYSWFAGPVSFLVIGCVALVTMLRRIAIGRGDLLADAGFLVAAAFLADNVSSSCITIAAALWDRTDPDGVTAAYAAHNIISLGVYGVLAATFFLQGAAPRPRVA